MTFTEILEKYRENSNSFRNQGDRFEVLMKRYLLAKPEFKGILSNVWLWSEFPYRTQFGSGKDTGIDIVAKTYSDDFWAVQCKFYDIDARISYDAVSTFYATSSLKFDYNGAKKSFVHRIWIDTTIEGFSDEAREKISQLGISRIGYFDLKNDESVDWQALDKGEAKENRIKYDLRPHQKKAFDSTIEYFADDKNDRGKLIMACGTGKTFTSLRIAEEIAGKGRGLVLFLVPSISLLSQSLKEWCAQSKGNLYPICICSDSKASGKKGMAMQFRILYCLRVLMKKSYTSNL